LYKPYYKCMNHWLKHLAQNSDFGTDYLLRVTKTWIFWQEIVITKEIKINNSRPTPYSQVYLLYRLHETDAYTANKLIEELKTGRLKTKKIKQHLQAATIVKKAIKSLSLKGKIKNLESDPTI
ncbi:MAG: hypothetical protein MI866_20180, partial [Bacteroidales bacterium]|nr:hypothetical protein [Bacteroidales bacterium]